MARSVSTPYILIKTLILKERWTIRSLVSETGISKPTVERHVIEMTLHGLIKTKSGRSGGIWWVATKL